jgi:sugar-phosphatase
MLGVGQDGAVNLGAIGAVLFDMDGTLVDSDAAVERAWAAWAEAYDADLDAVLAIAHGSPAQRTVRRMLPDLDDAELEEAARRQLEPQYDDLADVGAAPGAHDLLAFLDRRGTPWAVVTSADRRLASARLGAAGIAAPVLVTFEDISRGKPDPEGFLVAAERLGVDPRQCLVVEDAQPGVDAGHAAGASVAALKGLCADLSIANLEDLVELLAAASG